MELNFIPRDLKLLSEFEHLDALGKNFPNGCLFRLIIGVDKLDSADAKYDWMNHLHLLYASPSWEQLVCVSREKAMIDFMSCINRIHTDDKLKYFPAMYECLINCTLFNAELRCQKNNLQIQWLQVSSMPRREGNCLICDSFILDVTAKKEDENKLAQYRNKLELLVKERTEELNNTNVELSATNEELQTTNEKLQTISEELIQKNKLLSIYRDNLEQMVEKKTGELMVAKEKAEESSQLKTAFLSNMSHEIRTPLNGIVGLLNILADDPNLPPTIKEYLGLINLNSEILQRLIEDIIDAASIEAKQMKIYPEQVRLDEIMNEMYGYVTKQLQLFNKTNINIIQESFNFDDNNNIINTDPVRLRQVLQNLLGNAVKFTDKGHIRFGCNFEIKNKIEFFVEDTGIGLTEEQIEVIFQRFRQVELGNNRRFGGTGLGLTISRSLVRLMGGNMCVNSIEEKGSTFTFTIANKN